MSPAEERFMRTLASAFHSREEAEAAVRRLEGIGIARDRIVLKDVEPPANGAAASGGAFFVSVKVPTDQVRSVSEILEPAPGAAAPPPAAAAPEPRRAPISPPRAEAQQAHRPLPVHEPRFAPLAFEEDAAPARTTARTAARDRGKLGRTLVLYGLALVAAFIIGAWAGMAG